MTAFGSMLRSKLVGYKIEGEFFFLNLGWREDKLSGKETLEQEKLKASEREKGCNRVPERQSTGHR